MGLFSKKSTRKKEVQQPLLGPPSLPELKLNHNQSLPNLSLAYGAALPSLVSSANNANVPPEYAIQQPGQQPQLQGQGQPQGQVDAVPRVDPTGGAGRAPSKKPILVTKHSPSPSLVKPPGVRSNRSASASAGDAPSSSHARDGSRGSNGDDASMFRQASVTPIRQYHRPYSPKNGSAATGISGGAAGGGSMQSFAAGAGEMLNNNKTNSGLPASVSSPAIATSPTPSGQYAFPTSASVTGAFPIPPDRPTSTISSSGMSVNSNYTVPRNFRVSPSLHTGIGVAGGVTGNQHASMLGQPMYSIAAGYLPGNTATLSPDAARRAVDVARRMSLKKSKSPAKLNLLIVGGQGTGKTTFIRTLLETLDLRACSPEIRRAIATFGTPHALLQANKKVISHLHPLEPEPTKKISALSSIEIPLSADMPKLETMWNENISANAFYASPAGAAHAADAMDGGAGGLGADDSMTLPNGRTGGSSIFSGAGGEGGAAGSAIGDDTASSIVHGLPTFSPRSAKSRYSHASSRSHTGTLFEGADRSKKLILSLTDTPGFVFLPGQEFELERSVRKVLRQIEDKYLDALAEESKVQRRSKQTDDHYHAVLYFIDPLRVVEVEAPPSPARAKMLSGQTTKRSPTSQAPTRTKSVSAASKPTYLPGAGANGTAAPHSATSESPSLPGSQSEPAALRRVNSGSANLKAAAAASAGLSVNGHAPSPTVAPDSPGRTPSIKRKAVPKAATALGHDRGGEHEAASDSEDEQARKANGAGGSFLGMSASPSSAHEQLPAARASGESALPDSPHKGASGIVDEDDDAEDETDPAHEVRLRLSQQERKIILRLSQRANIIPVLAKADLLTEQRCLEVKAAIRLSFKEMGLPAGPYVAPKEGDAGEEEVMETMNSPIEPQGSIPDRRPRSSSSAASDSNSERSASQMATGLDGEPIKRIKLRSRRSFSKPAHERPDPAALLNGSANVELDHTPPLFNDKLKEEMAAEIPPPLPPLTPRAESNLWPFTLILPEPDRPAPPQAHSRSTDLINGFPSPPSNVPPVPPIPPQHKRDESGAGNSADSNPSIPGSPAPTSSIINGGSSIILDHQRQKSKPDGPLFERLIPTDPGRRFQRRYRWGAIDVLNPDHCDFTALRATILHDQVSKLRESTRVRYEEFRAERLQVRRETLSLTSEQRKALTKSLNLL